jgi:hypothetical protein
MLREHCTVGMKVIFGRGNGAQTLGEVVKVNPTKAKVKTLESRGNGRGSMAGAVWTVPYSLIKPAGVAFIDAVNALPPPSLDGLMLKGSEDLPMAYNDLMPHGDRCIMEAIVDTYNRLSPEWLTCDGELPLSQVVLKKSQLARRLKSLFQALGRPVSESVAYQWDDERRKNQAV